MKILSALSVSVFALTFSACGQSANAQKLDAAENSPQVINASATTDAAAEAPLVVAELFTSQGCSSCPSAEAFFSKLADRDGVLTLEWHVDYWDQLVHHGSRWKDPYSKKTFTARQRSYNRSLRGQSGVYTPQAIINGHFEGVGSRQGIVNDMIENAPTNTLPVKIANNKVVVGAGAEAGDVMFLRLLKQHETNVKGGENKGRKLHGRNIVLEASVIGTSGSSPAEFPLPSVGSGETCAVIVQSSKGDLSPILGAAKC